MFQWDFESNVQELVEKAEQAIEKEILPKYKIEYLNVWNASIKIKINDKTQFIEKLITCNFAYNNQDVKYGYIDPEFFCSEISKKTKAYSLWRFLITDHDKIIKAFIKMLLNIIEEY